MSIEKHFQKRHLWHFIPLFLVVLLSSPFLLLALADEKLREYSAAQLNLEDKIMLLLLVVQLLAYLFFSFKNLQRHRRNIENITAASDEVNLNWLYYFLLGVAAMVAVWFYELSSLSFQVEADWYTALYFGGIYSLGYFALRQREVFPFSGNVAAEIGEIMAENEAQPILAQRRAFFTSNFLCKVCT